VRQTREVLERAIAAGGSTISDFTMPAANPAISNYSSKSMAVQASHAWPAARQSKKPLKAGG